MSLLTSDRVEDFVLEALQKFCTSAQRIPTDPPNKTPDFTASYGGGSFLIEVKATQLPPDGAISIKENSPTDAYDARFTRAVRDASKQLLGFESDQSRIRIAMIVNFDGIQEAKNILEIFHGEAPCQAAHKEYAKSARCLDAVFWFDANEGKFLALPTSTLPLKDDVRDFACDVRKALTGAELMPPAQQPIS